MKKHLLVFASSVLTISSFAQTTINTADGPQLNQTIIEKGDTLSASGPGSNGPNITWNFNSLSATQSADTITFGPVAGTPGAADFTTSGLCIANPQDTEWVYLTNSSTALTIDGAHVPFGGSTMSVIFNPAQKLLQYPCTYMSSFTHVAKANIKVPFNSPPVDSLWIKQTINQFSNINAWGTLTTPYGTFYCLRQDFTDIKTDSAYGRVAGTWSFFQATSDTVKGARWWTNGKGFPVMSMDLDAQTKRFLNTRYLSSSLVGINESAASPEFILCYPNPATDELNFIGNKGDEIIISDLQGKVVHTIMIDESTEKVNTSAWAEGVYHYLLVSNTNTSLHGKIIVAH